MSANTYLSAVLLVSRRMLKTTRVYVNGMKREAWDYRTVKSAFDCLETQLQHLEKGIGTDTMRTIEAAECLADVVSDYTGDAGAAFVGMMLGDLREMMAKKQAKHARAGLAA